ncbi:sensor histidine kinase [Streptomyces sp. SID3343]|uniref:sensor histidine kinase n=1 Tax=Streptomyces sp. SID3343 TaxID=2690260 RepID=UPI001F46ED24|nr:sensor histidine kinase [Streptomyces sp. SID3343]
MRTFLKTPFTRRTWAETGYAIVGFPLASVGFVLMLALAMTGALLTVTLIGLPVIALLVMGARWWGGLHKGLARGMLGVEVAPLRRFRPHAGLLGRLGACLGNAEGWRAILYILIGFPLASVTLVATAMAWSYGVISLAYPLVLVVFDPRTTDVHGVEHRSLMQFGDNYYMDTWPRQLMVCAAGVLILLIAPWIVRALVAVDRLLIPALLGPTKTSQRVADLEETRAHAVDDSTATLRRIERDLHDGAQARLVALAMNLSMAKEKLDTEDTERPMDVDRARTLVDTALGNAREAIVELRDLARGIHPPVLDQGLDAALATLAACSAVPVDVTTDIATRPPVSIEAIAYFCSAELLTNVAHHSGATRARVAVSVRGGLLRLSVTDDGRGGASVGKGSGLAGLVERVRTVDGVLRIVSPLGGPTEVTVELPTGG